MTNPYRTAALSFSVLSFCLLVGLAGCSNAKKDLGLVRDAPDEFAVVKRAPLAMPPEYKLRPPRPGAPRPQELMTEDQARSAVFGSAEQTYQPSGSVSGGESVLLQQAGADRADPSIRQRVDRETAALPPREKPVAKKLLGIGSNSKEEPETTIVDAPAEAERLKTNAEAGAPVTAGETPYKER